MGNSAVNHSAGSHAQGAKSASEPPSTERVVRLRDLFEELSAARGDVSPDRYRALAALLEDAKLTSNENALILGQRGLQRLVARQASIESPSPEQHEQRGRVLHARDEITGPLQRHTPAASARHLEVGGSGRLFLEAIAENPGLFSGQIADLLGQARDDVISRVGRSLEKAGLARKQRVGRHKHWYITPRGRRALDETAEARR